MTKTPLFKRIRRILTAVSLCFTAALLAFLYLPASDNGKTAAKAETYEANEKTLYLSFPSAVVYNGGYFAFYSGSDYQLSENYQLTGDLYDATHSYGISVSAEGEYAVGVSADAAFFSSAVGEDGGLLSFGCTLPGTYFLTVNVSDLTSGDVYRQTVPVYAVENKSVYVFWTGGSRVISGTSSYEEVVFDNPYLMSGQGYIIDGYTNKYSVTENSVPVEYSVDEFSRMDFTVVDDMGSPVGTDFYVSMRQGNFIAQKTGTATFSLTLSSSGNVSDVADVLLVENGSVSRRTSFFVSELYQNPLLTLRLDATATGSGDYTFRLSSESAALAPDYFRYDFFLAAEELFFDKETLTAYSYNSLTTGSSAPLTFGSPLSISLSVASLGDYFGESGLVGGVYRLYCVAYDATGNRAGYTYAEIQIELTQTDLDALSVVNRDIANLIAGLNGAAAENYADYASFFQTVETDVASLPPSLLTKTENYEEYLSLKNLYDYSVKARNTKAEFAFIAGLSDESYVYYDERIRAAVDAYLSLPDNFAAVAGDAAIVQKARDYIAVSDLLSELQRLGLIFSETEYESESAARTLLEYYYSLSEEARRFVGYDMETQIYYASLALEKGVSSLSFLCGDVLNLLLGPEAESGFYRLSVNEEFAASGLSFELLILGDDILTCEANGSELLLFPYSAGECRILVYYRKADGGVLSDTVTVRVSEEPVTGKITVEKEGEGAYTVYDTLTFAASLSYATEFGESASFVWTADGETLTENKAEISYRFSSSGTHTVTCTITDPSLGIDGIVASREILLSDVADAVFTLTCDYGTEIQAYLGGTEIRLNAYLDGLLNYDFTYSWTILDPSVLNFYLTSDGPETALTPLKAGQTTVMVMVDIGKYQPNILMHTLKVTVFETIESVELYAEATSLKPGSDVSYRVSVNGLPQVANLQVDWSAQLIGGDSVTPSKKEDNLLVLSNLAKGKYRIAAKVGSLEKSETLKIQTVELDKILLSTLPFAAVLAFALVIAQIAYAKSKSQLSSLCSRITLLSEDVDSTREKVENTASDESAKKLLLKKLHRWKRSVDSAAILNNNLALRDNLELEVSGKEMVKLSFILQAGARAFRIRFTRKTVLLYLQKIKENNLAEIENYLAQKEHTVELQKKAEKEDVFATTAIVTDAEKKNEKLRFHSSKEYTDYLRKLNYYDADDGEDEENNG